jgi:hypothetical protein
MVHHTAIVDWIFFDEDGDVVPTAGLAQVLYRVDLVGHVGGLLLDTLVFGHRSSAMGSILVLLKAVTSVSNAGVVLQKCTGLLLDRVAVYRSGHHMSFLTLTLCRPQSNARSPAIPLSVVTFASMVNRQ